MSKIHETRLSHANNFPSLANFEKVRNGLLVAAANRVVKLQQEWQEATEAHAAIRSLDPDSYTVTLELAIFRGSTAQGIHPSTVIAAQDLIAQTGGTVAALGALAALSKR